ncbi:MAG TPA: hypothetical protein DDY16_03920 [Tenacibaculum sp.]|nr:hypothetical protein [Tenacibaculum sp.]
MEKKYFKRVDNKPHIWSSSSLYDKGVKQERKKWFSEWLEGNNRFDKNSIIEFHQNDSKGTPETAIKMKRKSVETVSITCISKKESNISFEYRSIINSQLFELALKSF